MMMMMMITTNMMIMMMMIRLESGEEKDRNRRREEEIERRAKKKKEEENKSTNEKKKKNGNKEVQIEKDRSGKEGEDLLKPPYNSDFDQGKVTSSSPVFNLLLTFFSKIRLLDGADSAMGLDNGLTGALRQVFRSNKYFMFCF